MVIKIVLFRYAALQLCVCTCAARAVAPCSRVSATSVPYGCGLEPKNLPCPWTGSVRPFPPQVMETETVSARTVAEMALSCFARQQVGYPCVCVGRFGSPWMDAQGCLLFACERLPRSQWVIACISVTCKWTRARAQLQVCSERCLGGEGEASPHVLRIPICCPPTIEGTLLL